LKREKIELENTLEKEQESLVNRLWKRMEKLETDKKLLQLKIQPPHSFNTVIINLLFSYFTFDMIYTKQYYLKKN